MFVGEQPGDQEDKQGKPFVGPAGRELDRGLEKVGIDRRDAYLTNVVKHFKFEERGKRRLHATPRKFELDACLPWLDETANAVLGFWGRWSPGSLDDRCFSVTW